MTGYETLQTAVADAQNKVNVEKAKLTALQTDSNFVYFKSILSDPRVQADPHGWISGDGTFWNSSDAPQAHANGVAYVNQQNGKIAAQQIVITDAINTLKQAQQALTEYEKNSPIGQQAAISAKNADSNKSLIVTVVVIAVVVVVVSVVVYFVRKGKKKKAE